MKGFHLTSKTFPLCPLDLPGSGGPTFPSGARDDKEGTPTSTFSHNCSEVGVHSTEMIETMGDGHRVIAVLAGWFANDVSGTWSSGTGGAMTS